MNPLLLLIVVFVATIIGLAVVAITRGIRKANWSTAKDVAAYNAHHRAGMAPGLDAVSKARRITPPGGHLWPSSEERAVRRLEGESIPSRFDRW